MINDGGPAFPTHEIHTTHSADGLSLRDYFAAAALTGICAYHPGSTPNTVEQAYQMADAMIAERNKEIK